MRRRTLTDNGRTFSLSGFQVDDPDLDILAQRLPISTGLRETIMVIAVIDIRRKVTTPRIPTQYFTVDPDLIDFKNGLGLDWVMRSLYDLTNGHVEEMK